MEKFSLYDLLGLLLPGVLFLHFLGTLNNLFIKANLCLLVGVMVRQGKMPRTDRNSHRSVTKSLPTFHQE